MRRAFITCILLLSCVSLHAQAKEACAQLPMPDVLSKMIIESINLDKYNGDADCYHIQFRECDTIADMLCYGEEGEAYYPVDGLMGQLEKNNSGYIFYSDAVENSEYKSLRQLMRKHKIRHPAKVVKVCVSATSDDEVSILLFPQFYERNRGKIAVSGDLANRYLWAYDGSQHRYDITHIYDSADKEISTKVADGTTSVDCP